MAAEEAQRAVDALLATDEVMVERMTKKGLRRFDARAAIVAAVAGPPRRPAIGPAERVRYSTWSCDTARRP